MRKSEFNFAASWLTILLFVLSCNFVDRNSYRSIHIQFGSADFFYHIYQNRPTTEREQMLVLRGVDSLPAEIELTVEGAGTLTLKDATLAEIKKWGEKTPNYIDRFKPDQGGEISCNFDSVSFSFHPDGKVKEVFFNTKFNSMPVKFKSDRGEATWPCSRSELKRVMGEPDKEVETEGRIAPNH